VAAWRNGGEIGGGNRRKPSAKGVIMAKIIENGGESEK